MTAQLPESFDYSHLTADPLTIPGLTHEAHELWERPVPDITDPSELPPALSDNGDVLAPAGTCRGVADLTAYARNGWAGATRSSWIREGTADLLEDAATSLPAGFGLAVFDAWRPLELQRELYEAAYSNPHLPAGFVSTPSIDPSTPPPHLTGGTVDVTLTYQGIPLSLGTSFDDFTPAAHTRAFEDQPGVVRDLRRLLYWTMVDVGFVGLACEWWHFEHGTRRWAAVTGHQPLYRGTNLT